MRPPTKLQVFPIFDNKNVTTIHRPLISRFISARLFFTPQVENEVKGLHFVDVAKIKVAATNLNKKCPKRRIFGSFSENVRPLKGLYVYQSFSF
jgi:hypothetical protein